MSQAQEFIVPNFPYEAIRIYSGSQNPKKWQVAFVPSA